VGLVHLLAARCALRAAGIILVLAGAVLAGLGFASCIALTAGPAGVQPSGAAGAGSAVSALVEGQQNLLTGISSSEWVWLGCALNYSLTTGDWSVFYAVLFQSLEGTVNPVLQALKLQVGAVLTAEAVAEQLGLSSAAVNYIELMSLQSLPLPDLMLRNIGIGLVNAGIAEQNVQAVAAGVSIISAAGSTPAGAVVNICSAVSKHIASLWDPWSKLGIALGDP